MVDLPFWSDVIGYRLTGEKLKSVGVNVEMSGAEKRRLRAAASFCCSANVPPYQLRSNCNTC
jgi:hypothetical protein